MPNKKQKLCDRCGNDLLMGQWLIHLPFKKQYVTLCHICIRGLVFDFYLSFVNDVSKNHLHSVGQTKTSGEIVKEVVEAVKQYKKDG